MQNRLLNCDENYVGLCQLLLVMNASAATEGEQILILQHLFVRFNISQITRICFNNMNFSAVDIMNCTYNIQTHELFKSSGLYAEHVCQGKGSLIRVNTQLEERAQYYSNGVVWNECVDFERRTFSQKHLIFLG